MKLSRFILFAAIACGTALFLSRCSDDEGIDNRDTDYGYVQFKLYKEASYAPAAAADAPHSRTVQSQLDYLADATKVTVRLRYNGTTIAQTLILSAADKTAAEFGLRSEKLRLLTGDYRVVTFALYDADDELLYNGSPLEPQLTVVPGGLTSHDLTVNVAPRGSVRFTLVKDLSAFEHTPDTRAVTRQYTFDEISRINITVQHKVTNVSTEFTDLPVKFSIHFDENNQTDGTFGHRTSSAACDSLLSLPAGQYRVTAYSTYDSDRRLLEINSAPADSDFTVADNLTTEAKTRIALYESDDYIKDYYALYRIWKALDGEHWSYSGENYAKGTNWNFNKDCDLWGEQPGVHLHSNGRVAKIDISEFGFRGAMPEDLGQLDQLAELYLGTHNDKNLLAYDPTADPDMSLAERHRNRMENHRKYLDLIHPAPQMSEPCARALREHGIHTAATALYDAGYTEHEIIDPRTGKQLRPRPFDTSYGKLCNGLTSLPASIKNLTKLENLNIANSEIESLPDEMEFLEACTDLEIYNCPKLKQFPQVLARMPKLVSLNISNNIQWSQHDPDGFVAGLAALASGPSRGELQILYCTDNGLTVVPDEFRQLIRLGLLDLTNNKIVKLPEGGMPEVAPTQLRLDHNLITEFPTTDGKFCIMDDMETFSASYNLLEEFPDIFDSKAHYIISTVNLACNNIKGLPEDFHGVLANTLTLSFNPLAVFPKRLLSESGSYVSYLLMTGCGLTEIPKNSFNGKYAPSLMSLDLTYNQLKELPNDFTAEKLPYLYGVDVSYNSFSSFPYAPLNAASLTVYAVRGQRDAEGNRCLREWPTGIYLHTGLRGLFLGSNDLRKVEDTISYMIYNLDISDNPNITFDASSICAYWRAGLYNLIYDKTQNIVNCDAMLE